jgi:hypothetical protein
MEVIYVPLDIARAFPDSQKVDVKYCPTTRNVLGEVVQESAVTRVSQADVTIDHVRKIPDNLGVVSQQALQGISVRFLYMMTCSASLEVEDGDVIVDSAGNHYDVLFVLSYVTHQEAYLRRWKDAYKHTHGG